MKKTIQTAIIIAVILFLAAGCEKSGKNNDEVFEIRERMFIGQVNDVYLNIDDYLGRTIKLEGVFWGEYDTELDEPYYMVYRYGPGGCCGIDGLVGFEVAWDNKDIQYPENDSWVEAIGELKFYDDNSGYVKFPYLALTSLNVLDERGNEYVNQ
jgi:uncharacterized membrane protein YcgQ (UPF0703/DUF1980 family)